MIKWEYTSTRDRMRRNELGQEGWEAYAVTCSTLSNSIFITFHLKRPITGTN